MSEFFAEATVRLHPDLTGFVGELRDEIKAAVTKVETTKPLPKVRIGPALTKDFIGDLRKQVNAAVLRAQKGVKPIRVSVALAPLPRGALREIQNASFVAGGGKGAAASEIARANEQLAPSQARVNALFAQGAVDLSAFTTAGKDAAEQQKRRSAGVKSSTGLLEGLAAAERKLTESERVERSALIDLAAANKAAGRERERFLLSAQRGLRRAEVLGEREGGAIGGAVSARAAAQANQVTATIDREAEARSRQQAAIRASNRALREHESAVTRAARSQAQLRRGALATSLSFLGIRGATLAASASFLAGAAAIAVFSKALLSATDFTTQLNVFRATTSATAQELERVRDTARALGADITLPGVTAADAAESMTELAKAGLSVEDSIAGARGVLQLATAAAIENAQAVELAANALNAFGLQGEDAARVADVFANAANAAQGSIVDIGIAFQQAAAAGRQSGLSFEDTTLFLTELARNGLRGSDAGTSLRTALIRLIRPTDEAREKMAALGIEIRDASGNIRPDIFIQIAEATRKMEPAARDAFIAMVGGQDAFRAISILGRQSIKDFIALRKELRQQGTAGELAAARTQGLRGSMEALGNVLSTMGTRIGQGVTPAIQGVVEGVTSFAIAMSQSENVARAFSGTVEAVNLSLSALGTTLTTIAPALSLVGGLLGSITNAIGVPALLAGLAAFKLFPPVLSRTTTAFTGVSGSVSKFMAVNARAASFTGVGRLRIAIAQLSKGFSPLTIGITAAAIGLTYLATRESAAEKATRSLTRATEGLIDAQVRLQESRAGSRSAQLGINAARLGVLDAQREVARARARLSVAPEGTFAQRRERLGLAVALDNVAIAQENLTEAIRESIEARDEAQQAASNAKEALEAERDAILDVVSAQLERAAIKVGEAPAQAAAREAAAVKEVASELRKRAEEAKEENTAQSRALGRRLELLAALVEKTGQLPKQLDIDIALDPKNNLQTALDRLAPRFGVAGQQSLNAFLLSVGVMPASLQKLVNEIGRDFAPRMTDAGRRGGEGLITGAVTAIDTGAAKIAAALDRIVRLAQGRLLGLERAALDLEIAGAGPSAVLANLEAQAAAQAKIVAAREKELAQARRTGKGIPTAVENLRAAKEEQARILGEVRSLQEEMAADAKQAADDAQRAQEERDENLLTALGLKRDFAEERITNAEMTESLRDDISATRALRQLVIAQIKIVQDQIKTAKIRIAAVRELRAISRQLAREIAQLQDQRRENIRDRIAEKNQLDIEFASINENVQAEIRARQREIARLKKLQSQYKKGTLEYKRLRNEIAQQQKAIADLRKQGRDRDNEFQRMAFEFLTRQQGFAATLMSNMLGNVTLTGRPGISSANLGGGSGGKSSAGIKGAEGFGGGLAEALINNRRRGEGVAGGLGLAGAGAAASQRGGTPGQFTTIIYLLTQMVGLLAKAEGRSKHPENKKAAAAGGTAMDTQ